MLVFFIALGILTLLAVLMFVLPLRNMLSHKAPVANAEQKQLNLAIFQDRLEELEEDQQAGRISSDEYADLRSELEKSLLNDLPPETVRKSAKKPTLFWVPLVLGLVGMPALAVYLYSSLGDYRNLKEAHWMDETRQQLAMQANNIEGMLSVLEQRLREEPEAVQGWLMLGRSYMGMERYPEASKAFTTLAEVLEKRGENPAMAYGLLAQSIFYANKGLTPGVQSAINKALAADPNETNALSLLGIASFQAGLYKEAVRYWQQVLDNNPNDPNAQAIRMGIDRARTLLAANNGTASGVQLQVAVSLADELIANARPDDAVFILARPANGGRMPLAVTKKRVSELPITITLDDSMAMGPMAKLSSAEQIEVVARISKAGTPQPQAGDIEGVVGPVVLKEQREPVLLVIDRVLQ